MTSQIPVVLFAYSRPDHLRQTLECLRSDGVPLIYAYSDGPRDSEKEPAVARVREVLRAIDWCRVVLREQPANLGLGRSILSGVSEVLTKHEAAIVIEDDLICAPGTYRYLCAALERYRDDARVMSVTGWTHPRVTPNDITDQPYFDGRAECWVWGTWARAWRGMQYDAETLMGKCDAEGIDVYRYGADLPYMAEVELTQNIWAVRFLYWHILSRGLCLRPPWSMVEHIGPGAEATNVKAESWTRSSPLRPCPAIPTEWPDALEHPACCALWQGVYDRHPTVRGRLLRLGRGGVSRFRRAVSSR